MIGSMQSAMRLGAALFMLGTLGGCVPTLPRVDAPCSELEAGVTLSFSGQATATQGASARFVFDNHGSHPVVLPGWTSDAPIVTSVYGNAEYFERKVGEGWETAPVASLDEPMPSNSRVIVEPGEPWSFSASMSHLRQGNAVDQVMRLVVRDVRGCLYRSDPFTRPRR